MFQIKHHNSRSYCQYGGYIALQLFDVLVTVAQLFKSFVRGRSFSLKFD